MRSRLLTLHLALATLLLPAALMFLSTGALYTWGIKGEVKSETREIALAAPLAADLEAATTLLQEELARSGRDAPTGTPALKKQGGKHVLDWTGSSHDVQLEFTDGASTAALTVKQASAYRRFVQLHKAKGGVLFKVYAAFFAASLLVILISGCVMAWQMPKYRPLAAGSTLLGVLLFISLVLVS